MKISEAKCEAVAQTLLDCGKILLAALVAADFIQFSSSIKITIVLSMITTILLGIAIWPDKDKSKGG